MSSWLDHSAVISDGISPQELEGSPSKQEAPRKEDEGARQARQASRQDRRAPTEEEAELNADDLLAERQNTHGDFSHNAAVAQAVRRAMHSSAVWDEMDDVYREALDHIAGKIGRICSAPQPGDMEPDHFADIGGYARLAEKHAIKQQAAPRQVPLDFGSIVVDGRREPITDAELDDALEKMSPNVEEAFVTRDKEGGVVIAERRVEEEQAARRAKLIEDGVIVPGDA